MSSELKKIRLSDYQDTECLAIARAVAEKLTEVSPWGAPRGPLAVEASELPSMAGQTLMHLAKEQAQDVYKTCVAKKLEPIPVDVADPLPVLRNPAGAAPTSKKVTRGN